MKFFKRKNLKEKFLEFGTKLLLLAVTGLFCLWMISGARAESSQITDISAQTSNNGDSRIVLKFSSPLRSDQVNVEFQRNFIQLSLNEVSAFPAKNQNIKSDVLEKIFTYQYKPDQARARILLRSDASKYKAQTQWKLEGNAVIITIAGGDLIKTRFSAVSKTVARAHDKAKKQEADLSTTSSGSISLNAAEEDKIVKEIISGSGSAVPAIKPVAASEKAAASRTLGINSTGDEPLFSHPKSTEKLMVEGKEKSVNPVQKMITGLLTVIAIMGAVAFGFRKFANGRGLQFGKFGSRQNRMIDVAATHMLGAKKSIALVRVADQYLVLGISGENINLLTNLGADAKVEKYLDEQFNGNSFDGALQKKMNQSVADDFEFSAGSAATQKIQAQENFGIRDSIKRRLTGFKTL